MELRIFTNPMMFITKHNNTNLLDWILGRIIVLIPGADQIPRVAVIGRLTVFLKNL